MRSTRLLTAVTLVAGFLASAAPAAVFTTVTATTVDSDGSASTSGGNNTVLSYTFTGLSGPYTLSTINFSGMVTQGPTSDRASEKRVNAFAQFGATSYTAGEFNPNLALYSTTTPATSTASNVPWNVADAVVTNGDTIRFRFYESVGDPGIDGVWSNVSLALDGTPFVAPAAPASSVAVQTGGSITTTVSAGQIRWYSFNHTGGAFNVNTNGSLLTNTSNDTELGLYDSLGRLITSDDDSGDGSLSLISLTNLAAGQYYLAAGGFNIDFGANNFAATSTSSRIGSLVINGISVPEPTTLGLLAGAAIVGLRRRR